MHDELDRRDSFRVAFDSVACSSSEAMKTSWYVPAGKHMLRVMSVAAELSSDE